VSRLQSRTVDLAVSGGLLGLLAVVAIWNALTYPYLGGFDAREHVEYAHDVLDGRLPETGGASYTPPGFYALAALAIRLGQALRMDTPEQLAQLLNVLCAVGSGVLVLVLARLLLPGRPLARWSALAFFACCPVVLKTAAMFHPQPLAMLLSLLALTTTTWMIARRDYRIRLWAALALSLAGAQLVRSVSIWVIGVVLVALLAAAAAQPEHRRRIGTALAASALAIVLLPLPWYLHNQSERGNAIFGRGMSLTTFQNQWSFEFYADSGLPDVIVHPQRAELEVSIAPILYADTWGDFFGIWSWGAARSELTPAVNRRLALQSIVGLPLTAFALAGWFALAALSAARWRRAPERIIVALAPLVGLLAVVYYATRSYRPDGDTVKALFLLPAVPFWAVSFGFAVDVLVERSRRVGFAILAVLALCLAVSLAYATFAFVS
jgi:4-amino-4-deoxy-L-arabinose transferase-like glycosyltransferase